ncbi:phage tail assembly protein [Pseudomonas sp. CJQ_7]|uniref:phage tail assembly protein n=1 Tax=Pseudomonas sp. CJQ_7 TaxID=3367166 RepID=UPI00370CDD6B
MTTKKTPAWLSLSADRVTVTLSKPTELNSVTVDAVSLRSPTVRDIRAAQKTGGDDDEQRELNLFASLAEVSAKDLEGMALKDYSRLQTAYFRLVQDDDV